MGWVIAVGALGMILWGKHVGVGGWVGVREWVVVG